MTTKSLVGQTFGKYRIVEPLGRGGMAEVYKAYQENLDRYVAIKVMHAFLADEEDFLARFQREAKAMASLNHNNIVSVYDFDVQNGMSYIVMEFVSGGTLKNRLEELSHSGSRMSLVESTQLVMEVAGALAYAHAQGMVHRDIKPGNIMLSETGHAVLTDFGIAKILSGPTVTATGAMIGTPAYMSPEQGLGKPGDERSDLYALGVLFYQMTTGRLPYDADTPLAVILKHVNEPIPHPAEFNENIPTEIQAVVLKAMAKDPKERYQSAKEMMVDLRDAASSSNVEIVSAAIFAAVRDRPTPVPETKADETKVAPPEATVVAPVKEATPPPAPPTRVASPGAIAETEVAGPGPTAAPPTVVAPPKEVEPVKKKSRLWIIGLVLLFLVIAAGAGGFFIFGGGGSPTPTPEEAVIAVQPTDTVEPTATPEEEELNPTADNVSTAVALIAATLTAQPTNTAQPTSTEKPTSTPTPDVTATFLAGCENNVELVNSYTFENENSSASPTGINFTMNWVIRNSGTCPLPSGLDLVHDSGHEFEGSDPITMEQPLAPGDEITLNTTLRAPDSPGRYGSSWQLLDGDGNPIGSALEFEINVYVPQTPTPRATNTPVITPTPAEQFRFDVSAGNCVYVGADWECDLYVNVYGGLPPYTVLISDAVPPSQYNGPSGPFTHTIVSRRCNPWVNKVTVRDSAGQELSVDRYIDPDPYFQGGCQAPPFED